MPESKTDSSEMCDLSVSLHAQSISRFTDDSSSYYENPVGIIFLTVGTAGDELAQIKKYEDYFVIQQDDVYGFLNLDLENNGKSLVGDFHSNNDDEIIDHFELTKAS